LSYVEYLIVLCVVALLGFGAWRTFGEALSGEIQAAGTGVSQFHAAAGRPPTARSSTALSTAGTGPTSSFGTSSFGDSVMESVLGGSFQPVGGRQSPDNTYYVDSEAIRYLKQRLRDAGIEPPAGDSGELVGPHGVRARVDYDRSTGALSVTVTDRNFYVGYDDIWKALDEQVAPYISY